MLTQSKFYDIYTSILKSNKKPVISVDTTQGPVFVPRDLIETDGSIQFCVAPEAVHELKIKDDTMYFRASFNKKIYCLSFPIENIKAVFEYAE